MTTQSLFMGGTATFKFIEPIAGYTIAMTGGFAGGAYARVVGEPREGKAGHLHLDLEHYFMREDGSTLRTNDRSTMIAVDGETRRLAETHYTVVEATGAFAGLQGQFRSWGSVDTATGEGVLRFSGQLAA